MSLVTVYEGMHFSSREFAAGISNAWESSSSETRNDLKSGVLPELKMNKLSQIKTVSGDAWNRTSMIQVFCTKDDNNVKCHKVILQMPENAFTENASMPDSVLQKESTPNQCEQNTNTNDLSANPWATSARTAQLMTCESVKERAYPLFKREELERRHEESQSSMKQQANKTVLTEKCLNTDLLAKPLVKKSLSSACDSHAKIISEAVNRNGHKARTDEVNNSSPQQREEEQDANKHSASSANEDAPANPKENNLSPRSHCNEVALTEMEAHKKEQPPPQDMKQTEEADEHELMEKSDTSTEEAAHTKLKTESAVLSAFDVMKSAAAKRNRGESESGNAVKIKLKRRKSDVDTKEENKASKAKKVKEKELSNTKSIAKLARASAKNRVQVVASSDLFDDDDDNDNSNNSNEDSKRSERETDHEKLQQLHSDEQRAISSTELERNDYHNNTNETMSSSNGNRSSEIDSKAVSEFAIANSVNDDIILCDETIPSVFRPPTPVSKEKKHANSSRNENANNSAKVKANVDKGNDTSHQLTLQCFFTPAVISFQQEYMREEKTEMSVINSEYICRDIIVYRSAKTGNVITEEEYYKQSNALLKK